MKLREAEELAHNLMKLHKVPTSWSFCFDSSKVRFGKCNYLTREISVSRHLVKLNSEREVRDTILHEIAHVLAPRGAGHGPAWRSVAKAIGCDGRRCYGDEVVRPRPKYQGKCPSCRRVIYRHRRNQLACAHCSPVFDASYLFVWSKAE